MENLVTIQNVRGFIDENGMAQLHIEDISRGLGFTQVKNGVEYVRWDTINGYLNEFGFSQQVGKDQLIPENIFYRLAMKAKNETAEKFQILIADEILPAIRKTGSYSAQLKSKDEIIMLGYQAALEKIQLLEIKAEQDKPKVIHADAVSASKHDILIRELAKILRQNGIEIGEHRLFRWLRNNGYLEKHRNFPMQKAMELELFRVQETSITHSGGNITVSFTPKVTPKGQNYFINKFLEKREKVI